MKTMARYLMLAFCLSHWPIHASETGQDCAALFSDRKDASRRSIPRVVNAYEVRF